MTCGGGSVVVTRTVVGAIFECHQINLPKENLKQACLFHGKLRYFLCLNYISRVAGYFNRYKYILSGY